MARHTFGQTLTDWTMVLGTSTEEEGVTTAPVDVIGPKVLTFWSQDVGGVQYTDLLDSSGVPATTITSSDGTGALPVGTVPQFQGPDGITEMWADAGGSVRYKMLATDLGADVTSLAARMEDAENLLEALEALAAAAIVTVVYDEDTSTWPVRPAIAGSRVVYWHGPNASPPPAGYMAQNDEFFGWAA